MRRASRTIPTDAREAIACAVRDAEAATSAEIVPVVVTASGRYDRAEDIVGLLCGLIAVSVTWMGFQRIDPVAGGWTGLPLAVSLPVLLGIGLGGVLVGVFVAMRVDALRRLLVGRGVMHDEVARHAAALFHDSRIHHTQAATGVMIFVALFERQAVVLADDAAFAALGAPAIAEQCAALTADLRRGDVPGALVRSIERLGGVLSTALPGAASGDVNELPDALILID